MKRPTTKQIEAEIEKLREMKPRVISQSMFGDNHHDAIDAQIKVLEESPLDESEIDQWAEDEGWKENVRSAASDAYRWMDADGDESPSENWKSLVR